MGHLLTMMTYLIKEDCVNNPPVEEISDKKGVDHHITMVEQANAGNPNLLQEVKVTSCPKELVSIHTDYKGANYCFFNRSVRMSDYLIIVLCANKIYYIICELKGSDTSHAKKQIECGYWLSKMVSLAFDTALESKFSSIEDETYRQQLINAQEEINRLLRSPIEKVFMGIIFDNKKSNGSKSMASKNDYTKMKIKLHDIDIKNKLAYRLFQCSQPMNHIKIRLFSDIIDALG